MIMETVNQTMDFIDILGKNNRVLVFLIGIPGSGKTTLVNEFFADYPQYTVISKHDEKKNYNPSCYEPIDSIIVNKIQDAFAEGSNIVIYDGTMWDRNTRTWFIKKLRGTYDILIGLMINAPLYTCMTKIANSTSPHKKQILKTIEIANYHLYNKQPNLREGFDILLSVDTDNEVWGL